MDVGVLGPLEVFADGASIPLGEPKTRQVLTKLVLHRNRPVSITAIARALWGDDAPSSATVTVQGHIARLRKALEPERAPRTPSSVLRSSSLGYTLHLPDAAIDVAVLEATLDDAAALIPVEPDRPWVLREGPGRSALPATADALQAALRLWRGQPYAELTGNLALDVERSRLRELRTAALELRELIRMHSGEPAAAARTLEMAAALTPHRERLWVLWAAALALADRQADALDALRRLRSRLRGDLGVRASPTVGVLETQILQHRLRSSEREQIDVSGLREAAQRAAFATHWQDAGAEWAGAAWRSVLTAAEFARADNAYLEEARLTRLGAQFQHADPSISERQRFDTLMALADACRWGGDWKGVVESVDEAILLVSRIGDDALTAQAATATIRGALWLARPFGVVHAFVLDALERLYERMSGRQHDAAARVRVMLALATETYYDATQAERLASLVDQAIAAAEELGDPNLQFLAYQAGFVALTRPETVHRRRDIAHAAFAVAHRLEDPRSVVFAEAMLLHVASELGDATTVRARVHKVIALAERWGLHTVEAACRVLALSWAALDGDAAGVAAHTDPLTRLMHDATVPNLEPAVLGTMSCAAMISGDHEAIVALMASMSGEPPPGSAPQMRVFAAAMLIELGQVDQARMLLDGVATDLHEHTYVAPLLAAVLCQVASAVGADRATESAYQYLLSLQGQMCSAGFAMVIGPADLYLAHGAYALGDHEQAAAHLTQAECMIHERGMDGLRRRCRALRDLVASKRGVTQAHPTSSSEKPTISASGQGLRPVDVGSPVPEA